jgi:glutamate synthase (NADPH/NADH) small chain
LAQAGIAVSVYDREPRIGGLLASGVPSFKLEPAVLERRDATLRTQGIEFALGVEVDAARIRALHVRHAAVFIGTGAQRPRAVELPGQTLAGVYEGLAFLRTVKTGGMDLHGRRVLVLGGGDTAMDCVRSALRLGAEATVAYRGTEAKLRASPREAKAALEEGAQFVFALRPLAIEGDTQVRGVRFASADGEHQLQSDLVILAFGFVADPPAWLSAIEVETDSQGRICIDAQGRTSQPNIYAGGDNTHGPDLVVTALGAGRRAAEAILSDLGIAHAPAHRHSSVVAPRLAI